MSYMFSGASSLTSLDLSSAIFDNVTHNDFMFHNASNLSTVTVKDESAKTFIEARLKDVSLTGVNVSVKS